MKSEKIKIESVEHAREILRKELVRMNEYFAEFDDILQRVLKRISGFIEDAPHFSMEEMVLESYSCFVRMLKLAVMADSYRSNTEQMFINGREDMEEALKDKMEKISKKIIETIDDWVAANVRVDATGSMSISTAIEDALNRAGMAEMLRTMSHNENLERMDPNARSQSNLVALERLVSLGVVPQDVKDKNIEDFLNGDIASKMVGGLFEDEEQKSKLIETHISLLQYAPVYTSLIMYLFNYICLMMGDIGWSKFLFSEDGNLQKRYKAQKFIYWQTNAYRQRLDDLLAEELYDEGEPTALKVREFKKMFMGAHKSDPIVKKSKLCAGDDLRFLVELIKSKVTLEALQDYFFYEGVMIEIDKRNVPKDDKSELTEMLSKVMSSDGVTIFANNIVQHENYGDNYSMHPDSKIVKEDNNG